MENAPILRVLRCDSCDVSRETAVSASRSRGLIARRPRLDRALRCRTLVGVRAGHGFGLRVHPPIPTSESPVDALTQVEKSRSAEIPLGAHNSRVVSCSPGVAAVSSRQESRGSTGASPALDLHRPESVGVLHRPISVTAARLRGCPPAAIAGRSIRGALVTEERRVSRYEGITAHTPGVGAVVRVTGYRGGAGSR